MTKQHILIIIIIFLVPMNIFSKTDEHENLIQFIDETLNFYPYVFGIATAFGWDVTYKSEDQILSPDEILYFTINLERKSNTIDSIEIIPEYCYDTYINDFYGEEYLKRFIDTYSFKNQNYYKLLGVTIPSYTPNGHILTIPFEFKADNQIIGRDTLSFKIQGTDKIPPVINNPIIIRPFVHIGENIRIWGQIWETGPINNVTAFIKNCEGKILDEQPMIKYEHIGDEHIYYLDYIPSIESDFFIDIHAEDINGNIGKRIEGNRFTSKPHQKENDILLVYTYRSNFNERHLRRCSSFLEALDNRDCKYDLWDPYLRDSAVDSTILKQYEKVIYATEYFPDYFIPHLKSYLNNGGNLLVTEMYGGFSWNMQNTDFFQNYMCSSYIGPVDYAQVDGLFGNTISESMEIELIKGDDYYYEEILPVKQAFNLFNYNTSTNKNIPNQSLSKVNTLWNPVESFIDSFHVESNEYPDWNNNKNLAIPIKNDITLHKEIYTSTSSQGAAAIAVDSTYKLVFLAFPFEAIEYDDDQAELMDRIMLWFDEDESSGKNKKLFKYKLRQNYPNPFNASTTIQYSLSEDADHQVLIYNLKGQLVETLANRFEKAGSYEVKWNAINAHGIPVSTGVYFIKLIAENQVITQKMILMK